MWDGLNHWSDWRIDAAFLPHAVLMLLDSRLPAQGCQHLSGGAVFRFVLVLIAMPGGLVARCPCRSFVSTPYPALGAASMGDSRPPTVLPRGRGVTAEVTPLRAPPVA